MSFAFVFPGQGSQSVGMLQALAAADSSVRTTCDEASQVLGYDLWKLVSEGPEETLNATEQTQPAMLAAGVATWRVWRARGGALPALVAGHSLGEFTALVCAEALPFPAALDLVRFRAQAMQAAVPAGTGAMAAILGLEDEAVEAACREAARGAVVEAAHFNSPGQGAGEGRAGRAGERTPGEDKGGGRGEVPPGPNPPHRAAPELELSGARRSRLDRSGAERNPKGFPCLRKKSYSSRAPRAA